MATLASIDEVRGVFRVGLHMTPQAITSLRKSVLVTSAGASTRIEGVKLSDEEVKKIMQISFSSLGNRANTLSRYASNGSLVQVHGAFSFLFLTLIVHRLAFLFILTSLSPCQTTALENE